MFHMLQMLQASPPDDRMLLERPLPQALRLYALQLAGMGLIMLFCAGLFLATLVIIHITLPAHLPAHGARLDTASIVIILVIVSVASSILGAFVTTRVTRRQVASVPATKIVEQPPDEAAIHLSAAFNAFNNGDYQEAVAHGLASLNRFEEKETAGVVGLADAIGLADANRVLGWAYLQLDNVAEAESAASDSLRYFRVVQDEPGTASALALLGDIALAQKKFVEAEKYYQQATTRMEWSRDFWQIVTTALNRAAAMDGLGRPADAQQLRAWALHLFERPTLQDAPQKQTSGVARPALRMRHAM